MLDQSFLTHSFVSPKHPPSSPRIQAFAATAAKSELQAFQYDPGKLMPDEINIKVQYCGIGHSDLSMLDNEWG